MRAPLILLLLRGSPKAIRALASLAAVFALLLSVWAVAGDGALQSGLQLLLFAGVAGAVVLPVVGLALGFVYLAAWLSSLGGDRPRAGAPRRVR